MVVPSQNKAYLENLHEQFITDKAEISRAWEVEKKGGELIKIFADALFTRAFDNKPHKLTFVQMASAS